MTVEELYAKQARSAETVGVPSCYAAPGSIDAWRHRRMLSFATALLQHEPRATWLTVGDGRYGSDAAFLIEQGADAIASSLTDEQLRHAAERGYIKRFRAENAERMSLADDAVDYVLCKESYHHFPRPPMALYEMLRVARKAVVLIEPLDESRPLNLAKRALKRLIRGDRVFDFEPSGNFLYRLSLAETAKLLTAMGVRVFAHRRFNDFFHPRLSDSSASGHGPAFSLTQLGIGVQDVLSRTSLLGYGLVCAIVFKAAPDDGLLASLRAQDYRVVHLPTNPYPPA